jgi:uncharacterized membrane protein YecN with MAPEG domain
MAAREEPIAMPITAFYASLLLIVVVVLGFQVGMMRLRTGISILHGDNMELAERIRRHANFTETVPLALILLGAIELGGASSGLMHGLGLGLLVARIAHPLGLHYANMRHPLRFVGANGTMAVSLVAAAVAVRQFLAA